MTDRQGAPIPPTTPPREGHDDTRYGERSGSGANEPPRSERKEQREDWRPKQGPEARDPDQDRDPER